MSMAVPDMKSFARTHQCGSDSISASAPRETNLQQRDGWQSLEICVLISQEKIKAVIVYSKKEKKAWCVSQSSSVAIISLCF